MRPFFLKLKQPNGALIWVNMNQVVHITKHGDHDQSVLTFAAVFNGEPAWLVVDETLDQIGARQEWYHAQ